MRAKQDKSLLKDLERTFRANKTEYEYNHSEEYTIK